MKKIWFLAAVLTAAALPALAADQADMSKYKFVPGEKTLWYADFSEVPLDESPTEGIEVNGMAEAADIAGRRWLKLGAKTELRPPLETYPEELTIEFLMTAKALWGAQMFVTFENEERNYWSQVGFAPDYVEWKGSWDKDIPGNTMNKDYFGEEDVVPVAMVMSQKKLTVYVNRIRAADATGFFPVPLTRITFTGGTPDDVEKSYIAVTGMRIATGIPKIADVFGKEGKYVSHGVYFKVGSAEVLADSHAVLKEVADAMAAAPAMRLRIVGHTDSTGAKEANEKLSKDRAAAVRDYLSRQFGVDGKRLETDGKGPNEPLADNKTPAGRAQNRRVEFIKI